MNHNSQTSGPHSATCASHDEFLAARHANRKPRVSSPEPKLSSSFFEYPNEDIGTIISEVRTILCVSILTLAVAYWRIETDRAGI